MKLEVITWGFITKHSSSWNQHKTTKSCSPFNLNSMSWSLCNVWACSRGLQHSREVHSPTPVRLRRTAMLYTLFASKHDEFWLWHLCKWFTHKPEPIWETSCFCLDLELLCVLSIIIRAQNWSLLAGLLAELLHEEWEGTKNIIEGLAAPHRFIQSSHNISNLL